MSELKVCPFCEGEASIRSECDMDGFGYFHWVECKKCRARSANHFVSQGNECPQYYQEVREDWNNRPHENKLKADAVRDAINSCFDAYDAIEDCASKLEDYANKIERGEL